MRFTRTACAALVAAGIVSMSLATSAMAAAPTNDMIGGATTAGLGFSQSLDTTEATTDALDAEANANCGAPATDASVWYSYTAASDGGVLVNVSSSDFASGVIVVSGSPGAFNLETCGPGAVSFAASAGTTYYILAFDFDGVGNGGSLQISIADAPPPPTIDSLTVNPTGFVNAKTGVATISGTITCSNAEFVDLFAGLSQRIGVRATVYGYGGMFTDGSICTGSPQPWTSDVYPDGGKFAGGKSASFTFAFACGTFQCADGFAEQTVKLRGGKA